MKKRIPIRTSMEPRIATATEMGTAIGTIIPEVPEPVAAAESSAQLYRLLAWLSPGFPVGAFSYSHGLEAAIFQERVRDRPSLERWIAAALRDGTGRMDADTLRDAHAAAGEGDLAALLAVNRRALAYRGTPELALEASAQGTAFLATCRAAWTSAWLDEWAAALQREDDVPSYPAAIGAATARAGIACRSVLIAYLQAFGANLVSAGLRLGLIGQTDGQRIQAALEPIAIEAAIASLARDPRDFGSASAGIDLASIAHETLYTRLFRS